METQDSAISMTGTEPVHEARDMGLAGSLASYWGELPKAAKVRASPRYP